MNRLTTIACVGVIGATVAGTAVIGPVSKPGRSKPTATLVAASLPSTGARRTQFAIAQQATPAEIYSLELPQAPDPTPAPTPVPVPAARAPYVAARPWTPPAGYATINVPIYQQAMVLDCETSALRMGLAAFGHYYSDAALFAYENADTRPPVMGPNHTVLRWGDPYTNFVGQVNGDDYTPTGYGVYWPVILSIARSHGDPGATGGEGYAPAAVYNALATGHPVEVWVETNWARPAVRTWTAWDGRTVRYSFVEHAVILSGVSQTQVRVNDPLHGTQYWISKSLFEANWRDFNNMAVIF
ncbi:MAG: C39 family peptidase [Candidatus Dormibacteraeota bacterium]|nr:C39 family peptidase [Candidatus Dormibacteraeota bacterium]